MLVAVQELEGIRTLALQRAPVNALDLELAEAIAEALEAARDAPSCRAVVLTGMPGVFSAGIDTRRVPSYDAAMRARMLRTVNRTIATLYALPKPVVAAISGHALGGGLVLAIACDVRLAARGEFRLGLTEVEAGIPFPAGPLAVVQAELSPESLRRLALATPTLRPDAPALAGVVDRVVEPAALRDEALAEARRLAAFPAYPRVKAQLRGATCERLRRIVEGDQEPLLAGWIQR